MWTFGAGVLIATPTFAFDGSAIALGSPVEFGIVQEVSIDQEYDVKMLYGANQYPVDLGRGKGKISIKCKNANINAQLFNSVFFGEALSSGYGTIYNDLVGTTIPGTAPVPDYGIAINPPGSPTSVWATDLGVQDGNGVPFTKISPTGTPTGGQYLVTSSTQPTGNPLLATGSAVYVFSDIDAAAAVKAFINYEWTNATVPAGAKNMTIYNRPMGYMPFFQLDFMAQKNGKTIYVRFPKVSSSKISSTYKNDDFTIPEMDMDAVADSNNVVQTIYVTD